MRMVRCLLAACLVAAASGCKGGSPPPPKPEMSFRHFQPIYLDVANIDVIDEYKPPLQPPYVDHLLPVSPAEAVRNWVNDRLRTTGTDNTLQVVIRDASVVSSSLPRPEGVTGLLTNIQDRQYDAKLEVEMRIYSSRIAMSEASIAVTAMRTMTIGEQASLEERKALFMRMVRELMESANAELEKQMFAYFPRYINYAQTP